MDIPFQLPDEFDAEWVPADIIGGGGNESPSEVSDFTRHLTGLLDKLSELEPSVDINSVTGAGEESPYVEDTPAAVADEDSPYVETNCGAFGSSDLETFRNSMRTMLSTVVV